MSPSGTVLQVGADWVEPGYSTALAGAVLLAGIGTTVLFFVGVVAYRRRGTIRYFLVTVALAALVLRTVVGLGTILGVVPMTVHHLVSHGLDFLIAATILYAVYRNDPALDTPPAG